MPSRSFRRVLEVAAVFAAAVPLFVAGPMLRSDDAPVARDVPSDAHRSPVALALSEDGTRLLTANQTSDSVSLVDPVSGKVLDELVTGSKPAGVAISADGTRGAVAHWYGYDLAILKIDGETLAIEARVPIGPEPRGVAMTPDGSSAFVAVGVANEVVRVDLDRAEVSGRVKVGREPRGVALDPSGAHLLVGNARSGDLTLIRTDDLVVEQTFDIDGANLRQVAFGPDGAFGYVANMENRGMATIDRNIDLGWVLGQRLTRVALDGSGSYATQSLDPQGKAVGDVHGVAVSPDGSLIAVSAGGTHEVLLFRTDLKRLPWRPNGSRDLIHFSLMADDGRFRRVEVGGRPTEVAFAPDGRTLYLANYLEDSVQIVDVEHATLRGAIDLGGPEAISLARRGEVLFHDADRSHNQWYSCNTCHSDGHLNGQQFDTMNDGWHDYSPVPTQQSKKDVPTLRGVAETGPWTWHGWQGGLDDAMVESFTKSMQGDPPSQDDVEALVAYLRTIEGPPNPNRTPSGELSEAAIRGREVFQSPRAACATCHPAPLFTDGEVHRAGLETDRDVYEGYNPPSLIGVYDNDPYLHDGRAATLREALAGDHAADLVTGLGELTEQELDDLIAYLESL